MTRHLATLALMLAGACASAVRGTQPAPGAALPVSRLARDQHAFALESGLRDSLHLVVRDSATWHELWRRLNSPFIPPPALPAIDFQRDMVIVDALGTRSSGGYDVVIEGATQDSTGIDVSVVRTTPGNGCALSAALTQPVDVARLPASGRPVRFHERAVVLSCSTP